MEVLFSDSEVCHHNGIVIIDKPKMALWPMFSTDIATSAGTVYNLMD